MTALPIPPRVDLSFPLAGRTVPRDHGHALFGALCRVLGDLHGAQWLAVHPLRGEPVDGDLLALPARGAALRLRVEAAEIPRVLGLGGQRLGIQGHEVTLGAPTVEALSPAGALVARLVTIKGFEDADGLREAAARQLAELEVAARVEVGRRRVLRVSGRTVVGFGMTLRDLSDEGSLRVQFAGLGGKQRMGCGVFGPVRGG